MPGLGSQLQNIGTAMQGFSAGLQGNLPQFQAAQNQKIQMEQQNQMLQQEQMQKMVEQRQKTMFTDAAAALQLVKGGNLDGVVQLGVNRLQGLKQLSQMFPDIDPSDTQRVTQLAVAARNGDEEALELLTAELESTVQVGQAVGVLEAPEDETPAAFRTLQMRAEGAGLAEGSQEYADFMKTGGNPLRAGQASAVTRTYDNGTVLQVLPDGSTEVLGPDGEPVTGEARVQALRTAREEQVEFAASKAAATTRSREGEDRLQTTIDEGLDAAQGASTLRRAIDLLDEVETGGWNSASIKAKQWLGIESANEGELASTLGKSVLSQLRTTFGAAFTEREGARLEGIEARLGANTETNKRLLQQTLAIVERAANRAIDAAYEVGDERTARDIEDLLDFTLTDDGATQGGGMPVSAANAGVTEDDWSLMTPEERALF